MCIRKMWDKGKNKKVMFSIPQLQAQGAISAKLRRTPIMCRLHSFFYLFLLTGVVKAIFASRRPRVST